ncbi:hypothetical protein B0H13DRAFT_1856207 [Mycena leptocephala]|nr:hypothetical protein B0H13DRAFT_1856207 [Mycena leptocephala]
MTVSLQKKLWDALPSTTNEFIAGNLSLCLGMPIMLRANDATEMCMTKGQEGVVCGWHASEGPAGQQVLETLFVRLINPPRNIKIADLPENVVPLVRTITHITCLLQDDTLLSVLREQVGFDKKQITSGMSGYLRQELRELEMLDEITRLKYEGKLPRSVTGVYHRRIPEAVEYSEWKPTFTAKNKRKITEMSTTPDDAERNVKRNKCDQDDIMKWDRADPSLNPMPVVRTWKPMGLLWDSRNWSCAYNATFTVLGKLWAEDPNRWTAKFSYLSGPLGNFGLAMQSVKEGTISFENARDIIRIEIHSLNPANTPYGPNTTAVDRLAEILLPSKYYAVGRQICDLCGYSDTRTYGMLESYLTVGLTSRDHYPDGLRLQDWMSRYLQKGRHRCPTCSTRDAVIKLRMNTTLRDVPSILLLDITHEKILFDNELTFMLSGTPVSLKMRGMIYGGQGHFTCRVVGKDGSMFFHDGITTGRNCIPEVNVRTVQDKLLLQKCGEKTVVCVIYARDQ